MLLATRHHGLDVSPMQHATYGGQSGLPGTLVINPGFYKCASQNPHTGAFDVTALDLTQPGMYQIFVPTNEKVGNIEGNAAYVYNYIVAKSDGVVSPLELARGLAWLVCFGNSDDPLTAVQTIAKARNSNINVSCGNTAEVLAVLANQLGIATRYVHVLTADAINGFNDGHTVLEMQINGQWKLFDSSLGYVFRDEAGELLNVNETCRKLKDGTATIERIAPFKYTSEAAQVYKFNVLAWMHAEKAYTEEGRIACVNRLYQIPFVNDQYNPSYALRGIWGYLPPGMEGRASYVTGLGYKLLTEAQFMARFYS